MGAFIFNLLFAHILSHRFRNQIEYIHRNNMLNEIKNTNIHTIKQKPLKKRKKSDKHIIGK